MPFLKLPGYAMPPDDSMLDDLRREIDRIDDAIHDLIMARTAVVERVSHAKQHAGGGGVLRPGREARILRRLAGRHDGAFPLPSLIRIWRELISASVALQAPFPIAACRPDPDPGYLALAREQFGSYARITAFGTARQALDAVVAGAAMVAVVPPPWAVDGDCWREPAAADDSDSSNSRPRIIWHLPFVGYGAGPDAGVEAVVASLAGPEESGDDHSAFLFALADGATAATVARALDDAGAGAQRADDVAPGLAVVVVAGFRDAGDPAVQAAARAAGGGPVRALGCWPVPFAVPEPETGD